jgi:hypothetical protein
VQPQSPAGAGLLPPASPAEAGIQKGGIAGLLGGAITRMMDRALYSTPTFGGNFITEQAGGEVALRRMESAAAQKQQEAAFKAAEIEAKAGKRPELTGPFIKQMEKFQASSRGIDIVNRMLNLVPGGGLSGFPAKTSQFISGLGALFNISVDPGVGDQINMLRTGLLDSFKELVGQGQISKFDYEQMEKGLPEAATWTTNPEKLVTALKNFKRILVSNQANAASILQQGGFSTRGLNTPFVSVVDKRPAN